jgi:hypothetical protein
MGRCFGLSASKIDSYFDNFMDRFYIMHPFIDPPDLRKSVDDLVTHHESESRPRHQDTIAANDTSSFKWSQFTANDEFGVPLKLLLENAMALIVLALGEICEHTQPLRATEYTRVKADNGQAYYTPGRVYLARFLAVMSSFNCGDTLVNAQICLLAGLYMGQLARVEESMSWFRRAGGVLMRLACQQKLYNKRPWTIDDDVEQELKKNSARVTGKMQHFIVLASRSCMQLEGEILTEVHLPSSGIHETEDRLPVVQIFLDASDSKRGIFTETLPFLYTAHAFLWKRINQINNDLYSQDCPLNSLDEVCVMLRNHEMTLNEWRNHLPAALGWNEADPPSSDILLARLQSKYWEARYVVDRHFLDYALHVKPYVQEGLSVQDAVWNAYSDPREQAKVHIFEAIATMSDDEVRAGCQRCVDAAVQINIVFDGIPGRLIVPNIHSTAHA